MYENPGVSNPTIERYPPGFKMDVRVGKRFFTHINDAYDYLENIKLELEYPDLKFIIDKFYLFRTEVQDAYIVATKYIKYCNEEDENKTYNYNKFDKSLCLLIIDIKDLIKAYDNYMQSFNFIVALNALSSINSKIEHIMYLIKQEQCNANI